MAIRLYSHDMNPSVLRVSAATSVADNYSKMGAAVGADAAESTTTATIIKATGHAAVVGDEIIMTSGGEDGEAREVTAIAANTITLEAALSGAPSNTETFNIIRPQQAVYSDTGCILIINSTLNQDVFLSFDGSEDHIFVEAGIDITLDLRAANLHLPRSGYIYVKTVGTAPTSGSLYIAEVR